MSEIVELKAPVENVNDETVAIVRWFVAHGSFVEAGQPVVLAETTKASVEIESPASGFVWQLAEAGQDVPVGEVLCLIGANLDALKASAQPPSNGTRPRETAQPAATLEPAAAAAARAPSFAPSIVVSEVGQAAAPLTPRFSAQATALLQKRGVEPGAFAGRGLVRERDVQAFIDRLEGTIVERPVPPRAEPARTPTADAISAAIGVATRVEPLPRSKRYEGRRLRAAAAHTLPSSVTVTVPVLRPSDDADAASGMRSAALIGEAARLLRVYPAFNAFYRDDDVHFYEQVNVGYAIDLGRGLKVPVIRDADRKTLREIADEKQRCVVDYMDDALSLDTLAGGTFTITDLSNEGVTHFHPVINDGQSAILGVCADVAGPGGSRSYNLVLAFDHQLSDGRTAASYLRDLQERLVAHETAGRSEPEVAVVEPSCSLCLRPAGEIEELRHFLVRTVSRSAQGEQTVCTICLQDWYA